MTEVALPESILSRRGIERTPTSLTLPPDLTYEEYEQLLSMLGIIHEASRFWIADSIVFGEIAYKEDRYVQAALLTGLSEQACMNYASTARRVPPSRRRESLSFSHHMEVAALSPNGQRHWLKVADEERLSKAELRGRLRAESNGKVEVLERTIPCPECGAEIPLP